jgi:glucose/arabinose dehydrogenase
MRRALAALALAMAALPAAPAAAAPGLVKIGEFASPTYVAAPPRDAARLFVVERPGTIRLLVGGVLRPQPFADLTGDTLSGGERGLLSMAFAPDYATSGRFYVYLTATPEGRIEIREYRRSAADPNRADPASGRTLLAVDHPDHANHNGGQLQVSSDGRLWVATGDGGGADDPDRNAQDLTSRLGKMLRLDPVAGGAPETWASGLRNPWRFSFDRATGDLVIADVGQGLREEIDFVAAGDQAPGFNFGWPCWEGTLQNTAVVPPCDPPDDVLPVVEQDHASTGSCAVTGGYVVRDPGLPTLLGRYLYGDFCVPALRSVALPDARTDAPAGLSVGSLSSFGEDACGRLYAVSLAGPVYRIQDGAPSPCPSSPAEPAPSPGPAPPVVGAADLLPPALTVRVSGRRTLPERRRLRLLLDSDEAATVTVTGRLRGVGRFRARSLALSGDARRRAVLRIGPATARKLARAIGRRGRVIAVLVLRARDAAGNERRVKRRIRLV